MAGTTPHKFFLISRSSGKECSPFIVLTAWKNFLNHDLFITGIDIFSFQQSSHMEIQQKVCFGCNPVHAIHCILKEPRWSHHYSETVSARNISPSTNLKGGKHQDQWKQRRQLELQHRSVGTTEIGSIIQVISSNKTRIHRSIRKIFFHILNFHYKGGSPESDKPLPWGGGYSLLDS